MTETTGGPRPPPVDRPSLVLLGAIGLFAVVDAWVLATTVYLAPTSAVVREALFTMAWTSVGAVALWLRRALLARRILALTLVLAADFVGSFALQSDALLPRVMVTLTAFLVPLQTAFAGHLLVAYPTGRLQDRMGKRLVVAAYLIAGAEALSWSLTRRQVFRCVECTHTFAFVRVSELVHELFTMAFSAAWAVSCVLLIVLLVKRYRRSGHRQRRLLRLPYLSIMVVAALYGGLALVGGPRDRAPGECRTSRSSCSRWWRCLACHCASSSACSTKGCPTAASGSWSSSWPEVPTPTSSDLSRWPWATLS